DILVTDLTTGIVPLLELFSQIAAVLETGRNQDPPGRRQDPPGRSQDPPGPAPSPNPAPPSLYPETPSFDLNKRCRHCNTTIPWGQFECPSCGKSF
ncbi:MAG: hypothetical protein CVU59_06795, partial [Deltaproteobacteria bacterium HGW-Deltaproteobacteria-17]